MEDIPRVPLVLRVATVAAASVPAMVLSGLCLHLWDTHSLWAWPAGAAAIPLWFLTVIAVTDLILAVPPRGGQR